LGKSEKIIGEPFLSTSTMYHPALRIFQADPPFKTYPLDKKFRNITILHSSPPPHVVVGGGGSWFSREFFSTI
jgi:hypothetical protein